MKKISIADIILVVLFIIAVALALWAILGNSPSFEQIVLGFMLSVVFGISIKVTNIDTKLNSLIRSFNALAKDFKILYKEKTQK